MNYNSGKFVFSHIMSFMPMYEFNQCVERYDGNYRTRSFSCYDQFLSMAFAQLTNRESLRDIEICLKSVTNKLYHIGFRGKVSRSTLSDANERRDYNIYSDFAKILMLKAEKLYAKEFLADSYLNEVNNSLYALDSSAVDLCLSVFPWAKYMQSKSAIKLHTLLNLEGNIPSFIVITDGKYPDVRIMDEMVWQAGSIYIMDRGYFDFNRLYNITKSGSYFVIRLRKRLSLKRLYSNKVDKESGLICDQVMVTTYRESIADYPSHLRRIKFFDKETNKTLEFLTNNFDLPALVIARIYKQRWQVELFFKWIKQHLRIKAFYGTSANAVKTQIWIAISVYLLIAIIKKTLKLDESLYTLSQIFSISLFERTKNLSDFVKQNYKNTNHEFDGAYSLFSS